MSLRVIKPGPLSTLQDLGRQGHAALGMSPGGPMDEQAFAWANYLLNNPPEAAQVEITLGPSQFIAEKPIHCAVTGADFDARINGQPLPCWSTAQLEPGDLLEFRQARHGLRGYLAVGGGFQVAAHYASCSTVMREKLGGLRCDGEPLKAQDLLNCSASHQTLPRQTPWAYQADYQSDRPLRFIPGPEWPALSADQQAAILTTRFVIQAQSNRMGYRLKGPSIKLTCNKLSEGQCRGTIQLPPDGQPIILMADHQTIGGYPNLGCLLQADIWRLAQLRPGQSISFQTADVAQALSEHQQFQGFFQRA